MEPPTEMCDQKSESQQHSNVRKKNIFCNQFHEIYSRSSVVRIQHRMWTTLYGFAALLEGLQLQQFDKIMRNHRPARMNTSYVLQNIYGHLNSNLNKSQKKFSHKFHPYMCSVKFTHKNERVTVTQKFLLFGSQHVLTQIGHHQVILEEY
jgi:hypothetical protein